jgi:uncharacterized LabA/DUF88 family protein
MVLEHYMLQSGTYIFIDGGYLLRQHSDVTRPWFGTAEKIDLRLVVDDLKQLPGHRNTWISVEMGAAPPIERVTKAFYYDCLAEEKKVNETAQHHEKQVEEQTARLNELRDLDDCHIRLGSLKGSQRKQKEVDVLMAVDMMAHAVRGNMDKALLVTGDLDLRPAVEALVQLGVSVQIAAYEKTTATELTWAASGYKKLTFDDFYRWTNKEARSAFPVPSQRGYLPAIEKTKIKEGLMNGERCKLYKFSDGYLLSFSRSQSIIDASGGVFSHEHLDRMELYFQLAHQGIIWDS